jgi:hypothetical protein
MASIHVGDIGTELVVVIVDENGAAVDVSNVSNTLTIYLKKPGAAGAVLTKSASLDTTGTNGKIKWVTIAGDLDIDGLWTIQGYVQMVGGQKWCSDEGTFRVKPNLA